MALKSNAARITSIEIPALQLQDSPSVYVVVISGKWLLDHTTPSWRAKDPKLGFQRIVKEDRARQIARTILDRERAFPNAITLATDIKDFKNTGEHILIPEKTKFLVVDGQHRLWAQNYSQKDGRYACIIHLGKTEKEMAELFLEINENQRRVPSSLRWDLVRLVRPAGDEAAIMASELVLALVERDDSPFYTTIDLTGEQKELNIKQGSLAPEIKTLVTRTKKSLDLTFDDYLSLLIRFFSAIKSLNPRGWGDPKSTYYQARVLRALLRVLTDMAVNAKSLNKLTTLHLHEKLKKIDPDTLSKETLRASQGSAGVTDLYQAIKGQVLP
jgi:DGQHR domain-containing protein